MLVSVGLEQIMSMRLDSVECVLLRQPKRQSANKRAPEHFLNADTVALLRLYIEEYRLPITKHNGRKASSLLFPGRSGAAKANIKRCSCVFGDGLSCFIGLADAGMRHVPVPTGGGRPKNSISKWVNTGLGNIKSAVIGTCRNFDGQHTPRRSIALVRTQAEMTG